MSITQTYFLAHTARGKLASAAAQGDHDLRLLVGHANLLDSLTVELQDAEREQDAWFNETVRASRKREEPKRVQWKDNLAAQIEAGDIEIPDASDSDSDSDADSDDSDAYDGEEEDAVEMMVPARRIKSPKPETHIDQDDEDMFAIDEEEDEEELASLALTRTQSHSSHPPELVHDLSDDSDDDMAPPSPPPVLNFGESQFDGIKAQDFGLSAQPQKPIQAPLLDHDHFSDRGQAPLVAAC